MIIKIKEALQRIEKEKEVRVIYACESGSRGWGFESTDSDYDVRFIYVHPLDWYLSIGDQEEIIEMPIDGKLDINGWDIRKSLNLLRKSNSVLLEWLASPITYYKHDLYVVPLAELARKAFMPGSSCHHYLGMATGSLTGFQTVGRVKIKSYLYAVRPVLCCKWIVRYGNQPPMLFGDLVAEFLPDQDGELRQYIDYIVRIKKTADEGVCVDRSPLLENYLYSQLAELKTAIPENSSKLSIEEFNDVFKMIVKLGIYR